MMVDSDLQKRYWEADDVLVRRSATHPAVKGFVLPKLAFFRECLQDVLRSQLSQASVLDVGAGNGFFSHYLLETFGQVTAVDFSGPILRGNPCASKVIGDASSLPFRDRSFDVVLCSNLLHHVPDPQQAVDEMARVADLAVVVSEPNRNNPLMFSFGALVPSERGTLKFNHRFLKTLMISARPALELVNLQTQGVIVPNKVPSWAVPLVKPLESVLFPRMYLLSVARRVQTHAPLDAQ